MATFIRHTGDERTPMEHERKIFKEYLQRSELTGMTGKAGSNKVIIVDKSFKAGSGDTKRYHFVPQNKTDGMIGQNVTVTGNEESLDEFYMDLTLNEVNKAFRKKGDLTDIRTIFNIREEFRSQLTNWYRDNADVWQFDAMTGYISNGMTYVDTVNNLALPTCTEQLVEGEGRLIIAKGADSYDTLTAAQSTNAGLIAAGLGTDDKMNTVLLDELEILAKQGNSKYRIRPIKVGKNGAEYFILFLDIRAYRDLRQNSDWKAYALSLVEAGIKDDPIATGAIGVWNNIIIKKSERIRRFQDGSSKYYARNLLVGANALLNGWAKTLDYREEEFDYAREMGVNASEIRGHRKFNFDDVDLGIAQVVTAAN